MTRASKAEQGLRILAGALIALLFLLPLYWIITASLRPAGLPPARTVEWFPPDPTLANYPTIFEMLPMGRYLGNSLLVVAVAVPVTVVVASWAGFALAQYPAAVRQRLLSLSVAALMIPGASVWIFRFQILGWLGLLDSLGALIVPAFAAGSPLFVLLYYWTYRRVPKGLYEAARLDGASAFETWWLVARPLARPTTIGVLILSFVLYWSDFISPVLYLYRPALYTLPVGLQILKQLDPTGWPLLMAAATIMTLPVVLLFILLQRAFLNERSLAELLDRN